MLIEEYEVMPSVDSDWKFDRVQLSPLSLIVGDSGSGKTRFLNTVFNICSSAVQTDSLRTGAWYIVFSNEGRRFRWEIRCGTDNDGSPQIERESLVEYVANGEEVLVDRHGDIFTFRGQQLPKLSRGSTSISLLKEEDRIDLIHRGFTTVLRRRFFSDELKKAFQYQAFDLERAKFDKLTLTKVFHLDTTANVRLYILSRYHPKLFKSIVNTFKGVFPFVQDVQVRDLKKSRADISVPGYIPTVCLREPGVDAWIPAEEISSGMQKVLLVLTDLHLLPDGGVYMLDEYENSLGIGAINFLPDLLVDRLENNQFLLTSHHPYIINKIPPSNWYVFNRVGAHVRVRYGQENTERYGRSKQQRFVQLLNDPFYQQGVE